MSQKYNILFYVIIAALVLPGQAVAVEDACSFIQDVNERVSCEAKPFPRPCDIIQNVNDRENCKKFNNRMATGMSSNTPPPPPPCNGPPGHECDQNPDGTPIMLSGPPPWCTGPKGRECENEDGTPIQPPMQDPCATIQDINERLKCQGQPVLGAGVPGGPPPSQATAPAEVCNFISDPNEKQNCEGIPLEHRMCGVIQKVNERLACEGKPVLGAGVPTHEPGGGFYKDKDGNKVILDELDVRTLKHERNSAFGSDIEQKKSRREKAAEQKAAEQLEQELRDVIAEARSVIGEARSAAGEARTAADNADNAAGATEFSLPTEAGAAKVAAGEARAAADNADTAAKDLEFLIQQRKPGIGSEARSLRAMAQGARDAAGRANEAAKTTATADARIATEKAKTTAGEARAAADNADTAADEASSSAPSEARLARTAAAKARTAADNADNAARDVESSLTKEANAVIAVSVEARAKAQGARDATGRANESAEVASQRAAEMASCDAYSEEACKHFVLERGLELGGDGKDFAGSYKYKGCFSTDSVDNYWTRGFYGTDEGTQAEMKEQIYHRSNKTAQRIHTGSYCSVRVQYRLKNGKGAPSWVIEGYESLSQCSADHATDARDYKICGGLACESIC